MVCGGTRLISGWVGSASCGLWIRGRPRAGIRCRIGGDAREGGATDIVAEGVLESGKDGGELDLWGIIESGISELLVVEIPRVDVVWTMPAVVWLRRGGGGGLFVADGGDTARVSVWGGGGHSSLGKLKVGLGTAVRQLPNRSQKKADKKRGKKDSEQGGESDPPDGR